MEYDDIFPQENEDSQYLDKIQKLKDVFIKLIDESDEVRELLAELATRDVTPCLVVEISVLFLDRIRKKAGMGQDTGFTKKDIEFLKSINIEIKEER